MSAGEFPEYLEKLHKKDIRRILEATALDEHHSLVVSCAPLFYY